MKNVLIKEQSNDNIAPPKMPMAFIPDAIRESENEKSETSAFLLNDKRKLVEKREELLKKIHNIEKQLNAAEEVCNRINEEKVLALNANEKARNRYHTAQKELEADTHRRRSGLFSFLKSLHANDALKLLVNSPYADDTHEFLNTDATSLDALKDALIAVQHINNERNKRGRQGLRIDLDLMAHAASAANAYNNGHKIVKGHRGAFVITAKDTNIAALLCCGEASAEAVIASGKFEKNGVATDIKYRSNTSIDPDILLEKAPVLMNDAKIASYIALCSSQTERIGIGICRTDGCTDDTGIIVELAPECCEGAHALSVDDMMLLINEFAEADREKVDKYENAERDVKTAQKNLENINRALSLANDNVGKAKAIHAKYVAMMKQYDFELDAIESALHDININCALPSI